MRFFLLISLALPFIGCNVSTETKHSLASINSFSSDTITDYFKPTQSFVINTNHDTLLLLNERGAEVHIPANSFVDYSGNTVVGEVEIIFKEYTNQAEIAFSGIPMQTKIEDDTYCFNSSGMFELEGNQDGKSIEIAPNKHLQLDYPLVQNVPETDFYRLNDEGSDWELVSEIKTLRESMKPFELSEDDPAIIDFEFVDKNHPKKPLFDQHQFRQTNCQPLGDKYKSAVFYHIDLIPQEQLGRYTLKLSGNLDEFTYSYEELEIEMIYTGASYIDELNSFNAMIERIDKEILQKEKEDSLALVSLIQEQEESNRAYNLEMEKRRLVQEQQLLRQMQKARLLNSQNSFSRANTIRPNSVYPSIVKGLRIAQFGIYNCDRLFQFKNPFDCSPSYVIKGNKIDAIYTVMVLDLQRNSAINYSPSRICLDLESESSVVLFTSDQKIYQSKKHFTKNLEDLASIEFVDRTDEITSSDDVTKLLNM